MAPFNPQINPTQDPNYLGYSKGISQPESDKSMGLLFQNLGSLLDGGIKAGDALMKQHLTDKIDTLVGEERDAFTQGLEATRAALPNAPLNAGAYDPALGHDPSTGALTQDGMDALAQGSEDDLTAARADVLPSDLQNLPQRLETLKGGYEKGLPYTLYYGRMRQLAKDLREAYPGYREFIDRQINSTLGTDPANAYVRALVQNIAAASTGQNAEVKMAMQKLYQNLELPGVQAEIDNLRRTGDTNRAVKYLNGELKYKYDAAIRADELDKIEKGDKTVKIATDKYATDDVYRAGVKYFGTTFRMVGVNTPQDIQDFSRKIISGEANITDDQGRALATNIMARKQDAFNELWHKYHQVRKDRMGNEYTIAERLGGDEVTTKKINDGLVLFDSVYNRLMNKEYGLAFKDAATATNVIKSAEAGILRGPMGEAFAYKKALAEIDPTYAKRFEERQLTSPLFGTEWGNFLEQKLGEASIQRRTEDINNSSYIPSVLNAGSVPLPRPRPSGPAINNDSPGPVTLNSIFNEAKARGATDPKLYDQALKMPIREFTSRDTPDDAKRNWAVTLFSPENRNHLENYKMEYRDGNRIVPGKYSVYSQMTTKAVSEEAARLSSKYPEVGQMYINWAKGEFANQLFSREIKDLTDLRMDPRVQITWVADKERGTYRFDAHLSGMLPKGPRGFNAGQDQVDALKQLDYTKQVLGRLNTGISGLANVSKAFGGEPEQFIMQMLIQNGFDPTKKNFASPQTPAENPVEKMGKALIMSRQEASQNAPESPTNGRTRVKNDQAGVDSSPILHFTSPEQIQSVRDFMSNPTGETRRPPVRNPDGEITGMEVIDIPPGVPLNQRAIERTRK